MFVRITDFERNKDGKVVYTIQVQRESWGMVEMWEVRRRFSEFRQLHIELGDKRSFPSRCVLCRSFNWRHSRMKQLEEWLRGTVEALPGWQPLTEFLNVPVRTLSTEGLHQLLTHFRAKPKSTPILHKRSRRSEAKCSRYRTSIPEELPSPKMPRPAYHPLISLDEAVEWEQAGRDELSSEPLAYETW
jgi:hypothetical protein